MIQAQGLTKQYGRVRAVNDLSFDVQPGIVTGFLGPNGAGKSTTMRMIVGLDKPTAGKALINGAPYSALKNPLRTVGVLLDAKHVHPNRTARNHLLWIAASNGIAARRVDEVLGIVGLTSVAKKKAGGFSLGMSQRLGLATALLGDPEHLILDEPVNGLDPEGIRWVRDLLKSLAAEGRSVLVSSHLLSEMSLMADRVVVIGQGTLIANKTTYEFTKDAAENYVQVRAQNMEALRALLRDNSITFSEDIDEESRARVIIPDRTTDEIGALTFSAGVMLQELSFHVASLEDAFIEQTHSSAEYTTGGASSLSGEQGTPVAGSAPSHTHMQNNDSGKE